MYEKPNKNNHIPPKQTLEYFVDFVVSIKPSQLYPTLCITKTHMPRQCLLNASSKKRWRYFHNIYSSYKFNEMVLRKNNHIRPCKSLFGKLNTIKLPRTHF